MSYMGSNNPFNKPYVPNAPKHATPQVRLNSGPHNILTDFSAPGNTANASRSLTNTAQYAPTPPQHLQNRSLYHTQSAAQESTTELLIPPTTTRPGPSIRDDDSPLASPVIGSYSQRSSWESDRSGGPFGSPFDDSRAPSRTGSEDGLINTQTVSEKYNIQPSAGLLLFPDEVEKDDYLHNPDPNDKDGLGCADCCSGRGFVNVGGLALLTLGILCLFIGYPILTFVQKLVDPSSGCNGDPSCISADSIALLKNVRTGLIDPDTPSSVKTRKSSTGATQNLVFSDEFNVDGRTFYDGDDPFFMGMDFWYGVTEDLEWYDPDAVSTSNGTLNLRFDAFENHNLNYRSGMVQSWNKLCFKGGMIEMSVSLPGAGDTSGFWPGLWAMGNLGRPGYAATTDGMWPYSYDDICDAGITPNQSDTSGLSSLPGMKLPACTCDGADHPSPGRSRSAPEIDILEATTVYLDYETSGAAIGAGSQSFQCAPFDVFWRPDYDFFELYDPHLTTMNPYCGGIYQQAISGLTNLNNDWYDGQAYQKYSFEYTPGSDGHITWYVGEDATWKIDGRGIGPNGNIGQRVIPQEPLALIMNFGMSSSFSHLNMTGLAKLMPATMRVDYVRIYQDEGSESVTCDPPGYETTQYIADHPEPYANPNLTRWNSAGYSWPQNSLMHGCTANDNFDS